MDSPGLSVVCPRLSQMDSTALISKVPTPVFFFNVFGFFLFFPCPYTFVEGKPWRLLREGGPRLS